MTEGGNEGDFGDSVGNDDNDNDESVDNDDVFSVPQTDGEKMENG